MQPGTRKAFNVVVGMAGGAVVAVFVFAILNQYFKASMPDCTPGQIDGQCGLATFLQVVYSLFGAVVAWLIAAFFLSRYLLRRPARNAARSDRPQ